MKRKRDLLHTHLAQLHDMLRSPLQKVQPMTRAEWQVLIDRERARIRRHLRALEQANTDDRDHTDNEVT